MEVYDCDSDSEGSFENSVDDEVCYVSDEIPKFQFRYAHKPYIFNCFLAEIYLLV